MAAIGCSVCWASRVGELSLLSNFLCLFVSRSINLHLLAFPSSFSTSIYIWTSLRSYTLQICLSIRLHLDGCEMCTICESVLKLCEYKLALLLERRGRTVPRLTLPKEYAFFYIYSFYWPEILGSLFKNWFMTFAVNTILISRTS